MIRFLLVLGGLISCAHQYKIPEYTFREPIVTDKKTQVLLSSAARLYFQEKWTEARQKYVEILDADSKNAIALYNLGLVCYRLKELNQANIYFSQAVRHQPDIKEVHEFVFLTYYPGHRYFLFDELIQFQKKLSGHHYILGMEMMRELRVDGAIYHLLEAVRYNRSLKVVYYHLSKLFLLKKDYDNAYRHLEKAESMGYSVDTQTKENIIRHIADKKNVKKMFSP